MPRVSKASLYSVIAYWLTLRIKKVIIGMLVLSIGLPVSAQYLTERPDWAGIWFTLPDQIPDFTGFEDVLAGKSGRINWSGIEEYKGDYDFSELKSILQGAAEGNYYYYFVLWTGPHSPDWIYNEVPKVLTDQNNSFPYYLDENYKKYVTALFDTLAGAMASWPDELLEHLAFIQPGFGSTGDRQLYKGTPVDSEYIISKDQYIDFMQEMTISITTSFWSRVNTKNIMFLWNIDDYDGSEPSLLIDKPELKQAEMLYGEWMKRNYNCQLRKQQFTIAIGYLCPNEKSQDAEQRDNFYGNNSRWGEHPEFVRGEFNEGKWGETTLYHLHPFLYYYWTAISSVDRGLDGWELKVMDSRYKEAYAFSHRYSFYKKPEKSPYAFIALRDILDYSDTGRFPENQYGTANKTNEERINAILEQYKYYGAKNDDNIAAMDEAGASYYLNTSGNNDCLWNTIARNNQRFITQIEAIQTSAGYWWVGVTQEQPYGRFARGFDVEKGKNAMYFDVHDQFFSANRESQVNRLKVKIIYYSDDNGSWVLKYHATDNTMKTALSHTNEPGQGWVSKEIFIEDALLDNGGPKGADLVLQNMSNVNCKFHLIELERELVIPDTSSISVEGVYIDFCPEENIIVNSTHQLTAHVFPPNAIDQSVYWNSSDTSVAKVDKQGLVSAISAGDASISVITNDGEFLAQCSILVSSDVNIKQTVSAEHAKYKVYPNPFFNQLKIKSSDLESVDYAIFDVLGRSMVSEKLYHSSLINTSEWQPGIYYLKPKGYNISMLIKR